MATVSRYGVRMNLDVSSFPHCCGAKIIHEFNVSGKIESLTLEQKHKMYNELFRKVADSTQGMLVAADCVIEFGEWADLKRGGGGGNTSWQVALEGAGDISLEDFCKYHDFAVTAYAKNNNSGNIVATFSKAVYSVAADESETVTKYYPDMPDYTDDVVAGTQSNTDVASVLAQLREAVRRAA